MLHFKKVKITKNTCKYHYQDLDDMIYRSWDIEQDKLKLVILGHFFLWIPLKAPKTKILKNQNICWKHSHFTNVHQKSRLYDVRFLKYGVRQTQFLVILGHFFPFYLTFMIPKIKFLRKIEKNARR